MPPAIQIGWDQVKDDFATQLKQEANEFMTSTEGDITTWAAEIAADAMAAAATGRTDLLPRLQAQMKTLAVVKEVELREGGWQIMDTALAVGLKVATSLVKAAVIV